MVRADLYRKRWRIEEVFNTVKRLLGLSYLWTGSLNGVRLQICGRGTANRIRQVQSTKRGGHGCFMES